MKYQKILLSNDDGIDSPGIQELYHSFRPDFDVLTITPENQRSGESKAVTFQEPLRIHQTKMFDGIPAWTISGTPADAVIFAIGGENGKANEIDLVVSGINLGENTSLHSILTSGTCAVAFEAGITGLPAIAFSLDVPTSQFFMKTTHINFKIAATISRKIIDILQVVDFPEDAAFININYPKNLSLDTPIRFSEITIKKYNNYLIRKEDPRKNPYFWVWGDINEKHPKNSDAFTVLNEKNISISLVGLHWNRQQDDWDRFQKEFIEYIKRKTKLNIKKE